MQGVDKLIHSEVRTYLLQCSDNRWINNVYSKVLWINNANSRPTYTLRSENMFILKVLWINNGHEVISVLIIADNLGSRADE